MRPSQKTTEERKWVLDTINKYFDVIVEEENEEENDGDDEDLAKVELSLNGSSPYESSLSLYGSSPYESSLSP